MFSNLVISRRARRWIHVDASPAPSQETRALPEIDTHRGTTAEADPKRKCVCGGINRIAVSLSHAQEIHRNRPCLSMLLGEGAVGLMPTVGFGEARRAHRMVIAGGSHRLGGRRDPALAVRTDAQARRGGRPASALERGPRGSHRSDSMVAHMTALPDYCSLFSGLLSGKRRSRASASTSMKRVRRRCTSMQAGKREGTHDDDRI